MNVSVFNTYVQHSDGLIKLQGIELPFSLTRFFLNLFPCLLRLNSIIGIALKYSMEFGVYLQDIPIPAHNFRYARECYVVCY